MGIRREIKQANGIGVGTASVVVLAMSIVLISALIKIYLSNQIYYESKEVNYLQREVSVLKAEHVMLRQNIEELEFKNQVTDTIFVIKEEQ